MKLYKFQILATIVAAFTFSSFNYSRKAKHAFSNTYPKVKIAGAMKNVTWKGQLHGVIELDTISDKEGLYGLGPIEYLKGEILIKDGQTYISKVLTDTTMEVKKDSNVSAPFFVYGNVKEWEAFNLPDSVSKIPELEKFVDGQTVTYQRPFVFRLVGTVKTAKIHIQNLPQGKNVSSPKEAHQGQVNYYLNNEEVDIIGFFSKAHQGVFTHHDSFVHLHLITANEEQMGHLDEIVFGEMELMLPK